MRNDIDTVKTPSEICNMFGEYFKSVYSDIHPINLATSISLGNSFGIDDIDITCYAVRSEIERLCLNKGCGPDQIPPSFFSATSESISLPISLIFNQSIKQMIFPDRFKIAKIIPVYKSGDRGHVANYRPIAILSVISKIFEKLLHAKFTDRTINLISSRQHGFVKHRSTLTNLMNFGEYVYESLHSGRGVDVVYTDFAKAFDKVNHCILLNKLYNFGFDDTLVQWACSYLSNRSHFVEINNHQSFVFQPTSGVPQGSILGPLLFLYFINDISTNIDSEVLLFADDLKLYRSIYSISDCIILQSDLNKISIWCTDNLMDLNINKCFALRIKPRVQIGLNFYKIFDQSLSFVSEIKDLGITIDCQFSFRTHIFNIINKAYKILGFVMRIGSNFTSLPTFISLYNGLVRPNLEYLTTIWNSPYNIHQLNIERVQKKFTRYLYFKFKFMYEPYSVRLVRFRMTTLVVRRIFFDELVLFKIVNRIIETSLLNRINFAPDKGYLLRDTLTFNLPACRTNLRNNSPLIRLQLNHNSYFNSVDLFSFASVTSFKSYVRQVINDL